MLKRNRENPIKLRVLLAGHLPPPIGGVGTYYLSLLASSLPERVELLFVQTSTHKRDAAQSGRLNLSNIIFAVKDWFRFFRAGLTHHPQVSHIGTAFGFSFLKHSLCVVVARMIGSRVLLHPHCGLPVLYTERSIWWRWFFRRVISLTDGVIALSSEWKQISILVPGTRVYFLKNAISLDPYLCIAQERLTHFHENDVIRVLYLGNIGHTKGSFELLDAAHCISSRDNKVLFDIVGSELSPGEVDKLNRKLDSLNLSKVVKIHPAVLGKEKLACFRAADIFVYPSYSEGMPMAVIEAMASGLPVVATNVGGLPDLITNEVNGILVEPGQSDQLVTALRKIITDKNLRHSMGEKSSQIAREHYDIEQHVLKLVEIYAQCI